MTEVFTRQYTHVAGLAVMIYDQILTWDDEVKYIWRGSNWTIKSAFLLARYCGFITQLVNLVYTNPSVIKRQVVDCQTWFSFQNGAVGALLCNLELTLMLRIYALYDRSLKMGLFLVGWFLLSLGVNIWIGSVSVHRLKLDSNCFMIENVEEGAVQFSLMVMLNQCVLWGLTSFKYRHAVRDGWSRNSLVRLVMRDNSWCCLSLCVLFVAVLPYALFVEQIGHIIYGFLTALLSIMTCRIILNMRTLGTPNHSSDSGPVFTTDLMGID